MADPNRRREFRYYLHDSIDAFRLQLIGVLSGLDLNELTGCWATAKSSVAGRKIILDVRQLRSCDEGARDWMNEMARGGAVFSVPDGSLSADVPAFLESDAPCTPKKQPNVMQRLLALFNWRSSTEAS